MSWCPTCRNTRQVKAPVDRDENPDHGWDVCPTCDGTNDAANDWADFFANRECRR